jgi:hypothetical protein
LFGETSRDPETITSTFVVPVRDWMRDGFHFKLKAADDKDEPDRSIRVWRPRDGGEVWLKSGQVSLREAPLVRVPVEFTLLYPRTFPAAPKLELKDDFDDYCESFDPVATQDHDAAFRVAEYQARLYAQAVYHARFDGEQENRSVRIADAAPPRQLAVLGWGNWLSALPQRSSSVRLVMHPNPASTFGDTITFDIGVGSGPTHETVTVTRVDGTWQVSIQAFPGLSHWVEIASTPKEARPDGPFVRRRLFQVELAAATLHTLDGVSGFAADEAATIADVPTDRRRRVMADAFGQTLLDAGVFDECELPHGTTYRRDSDRVWFVLKAAHAVTASVLLLDPASPEAGPRIATAHPMRLTADLRYWWCELPREIASHGTAYRFLLNKTQEVLDPAARAARDPGYLVAKAGEGKEGPWSLTLDVARLDVTFAGSGWRTMGWEALLIYEMHPLRFTRRNAGASAAFDQVVREQRPGGYLEKLPVTALEIMPVHEFPSALSWGYNPSLFFGVDSAYGGPQEFAKLVRAAHDAGRAVLLDVEFNHVVASPLQAIARDVYVDGETQWGDMINYDHPAAREFIRQALVYLWKTFRVDGFRFDATEAIVNGHKDNGYIIKNGRVGSGGGWEFLGMLRAALRRAAEAIGQPWPYLTGENDPNNWGMTDARKWQRARWPVALRPSLPHGRRGVESLRRRQELGHPAGDELSAHSAAPLLRGGALRGEPRQHERPRRLETARREACALRPGLPYEQGARRHGTAQPWHPDALHGPGRRRGDAVLFRDGRPCRPGAVRADQRIRRLKQSPPPRPALVSRSHGPAERSGQGSPRLADCAADLDGSRC